MVRAGIEPGIDLDGGLVGLERFVQLELHGALIKVQMY
jgi:hypothetical protein